MAENFDMIPSWPNRLANPTHANCDRHPPPVDAQRSVGAMVVVSVLSPGEESTASDDDGMHSRRRMSRCCTTKKIQCCMMPKE